MMTQETKKKKLGNKVFLVIILVAIIGVYMHQRKGISLPDWGNNIDQAMSQAKGTDKIVIVFFTHKPPSDTARKIAKRTKVPETEKLIIKSGKYIPVHVYTSTGSEISKKYKVTKLPTLIAFTSDGQERNRHEGNIGEVPFRSDFLENTEKK